MKKLIAILLVMVMALSIIPLAFAEDTVEPPVEDTPTETTDEETPVEEVVDDTPVETTDEETPVEEEEETTDEVVDETPVEEAAVEEETTELSEEVIEEAGVTPDSFLWELERVMEKIDLLLTFDEAAQAQKQLELAKERLAEVQVMVSESKLEDAADAQEEHDELLADVEETIEDMNGGDEEALTEEVALEEQLIAHRTLVQKIGKSMLKTKGLTAEQERMAQDMFEEMAAATDGAKLSIQVKKNKTKIKIKAAKGMTDEEISALEEQARAIVGEDAEFKITGHKPKKAKKAKGGQVEASEEGAEESDAEEGEETEDSAVTVEKGKKNKGKGKKK
jgi:hypothetical protein